MFLVNPWHRGFNTERIIPKESMRCVIQINSNSEELRPEEVHRPRIAGTARQLSCQPALALARIVVREQMRRTSVPVIP